MRSVATKNVTYDKQFFKLGLKMYNRTTMLEMLKKDINILPYLPICSVAGIYGFCLIMLFSSLLFPLNAKLEYIVLLIFWFTKEVMPLHKFFGLYDNYIMMGQWPSIRGVLLDVFAVILIVIILNLLLLSLIKSIKTGIKR